MNVYVILFLSYIPVHELVWTDVLHKRPDKEIKVNFPRKLLDKKLKEGDYITLDIKYDAKTTKEAQEEVQNLLKSLKDKNNWYLINLSRMF